MARNPRRGALTEAAIELAEREIEELEISVKFLVTDFTVEYLVAKLREDEYFVPGYQRAFVWNTPAQSRFVESVLIGLPIPFLFLWQADDGRLEIVDGSQRLRTLRKFMDNELKLRDLQLLETLEGFSYSGLTRSRQRKLGARVIRGIVLDNSVGEATRTEMFNRINTGGTKANEAEVRRGALPGPISDLVKRCADDPLFKSLTPISAKLVDLREREEFAIRFFTFLESVNVNGGEISIPGWKDRPREYVYAFLKAANQRGEKEPEYASRLQSEFVRMLQFVEKHFPHGFRKSANANQVPRVRFEAIAVGTGLALRIKPGLETEGVDVSSWIEGKEFQDKTTSDAANVRAKVQGRISFVLSRLINNE